MPFSADDVQPIATSRTIPAELEKTPQLYNIGVHDIPLFI